MHWREDAILNTDRRIIQFFLREIQKTSRQKIDQMITILKNNFNDTLYDYNRIFFTGDNSLLCWTGYRLGYYFVKQHLRNAQQSIAQATLACYSSFII